MLSSQYDEAPNRVAEHGSENIIRKEVIVGRHPRKRIESRQSIPEDGNPPMVRVRLCRLLLA